MFCGGSRVVSHNDIGEWKKANRANIQYISSRFLFSDVKVNCLFFRHLKLNIDFMLSLFLRSTTPASEHEFVYNSSSSGRKYWWVKFTFCGRTFKCTHVTLHELALQIYRCNWLWKGLPGRYNGPSCVLRTGAWFAQVMSLASHFLKVLRIFSEFFFRQNVPSIYPSSRNQQNNNRKEFYLSSFFYFLIFFYFICSTLKPALFFKNITTR